ncbi:MAG TPA: nucleotide-binding protein [Bacilli bacterium]|nr:nucleotide-binding protein [Bacilli bacterium]
MVTLNEVKKKPKLFIGSSVEGLSLAEGMKLNLMHDFNSVIWNEGVFRGGSLGILDLLNAVKAFDFAAFVFSPDDKVTRPTRNQEHNTVRDNVIFECGLFMGQLGLERTFFVVPSGDKSLVLPTDLTGVNPIEYEADNDLTPLSIMGSACIQIKQAKNRLLGK